MREHDLSRGLRSRTTSLVAILVLTVALAAFLAYEAWDAARSHRAMAERAIRDYAKFAAWEFSVSAKEVLYSTLAWAFSPTGTLDARDLDGPLPGPSILDHEKSSHLLCARDSSRYFFRLDMRDGSFVTSGDEPAASMRKWMLDTLPKNAKTYKADWVYEVISGSVDGHPRAIVYQLKRDRAGRPAVAYGFELCFAQFAAVGLQKVMAHFPALPPSLTGGVPNDSVPNDSIFSVRVFDGGGHEVFRSGVQYPDTYTGFYKLDYFGGLKSVVALRPTLTKTLLIGELPSERLPLLLGVLALSAGLAAIGVMQLRRESELARLRSDFIASVSHELRTPLAQVRMFAETLLLGRVRSDEERLRSLQIVDQEARRLTHLVENILQFSRAEREAIRLAPVPAEMASQVREAVEAFAPVARSRHVIVQAALENDIVCVVDAAALRQILLNLLDNAVKYGPLGQTVTITLRRSGDHARIIVDDEGPGIPPEHRSRIWEPYQRLDSAVEAAVAGSGIGLAVVAQLVALHHGRAWVDSAPGKGARFVIELPSGIGNRRAPAEGGQMGIDGGRSAPTEKQPRVPVGSQDDLERWGRFPSARLWRAPADSRFPMSRVLVVEDNPDLAFGLRNNLEIEGYEVLVAGDGPTGLTRARDWLPDLMILDLMLPGMDGYRVLRALRAEGFERPVLILTARGEEADKVIGFRNGADDYVTKPFGVLELLARIEALLRRSTGAARSPTPPPAERFGDVAVDRAARTVTRDGVPVYLAPMEFELLLALLQRKGAVASRQELMREVWGHSAVVVSRTVDTHIAELRRKLEQDPAEPRYILTVRKAGYRLER